MTNKYKLFAAFFIFAINQGFGQYCTNDKRYTDAQFFDTSEMTIGTNVQYGVAQDFQGNPYTLRMDLYYPNINVDVSPKRPFIMLFHGGGFSSGDKQSGDIKDLCVHLALRGFVCASVNYRIGHDFSEYGQYKARYRAIQDGKAALRYVVNNANAIRIDTNWLFVGGQSAGSLLALGMVYADQDELDSISLLYNATATSVELGNLNTSSNNLTNTYRIKGVFNNWGGVVKTELDIPEMIPTIAFHGKLDTLVEIDSDHSFLHYTLDGSRAIHNALIAKNICSEITIDTLGEHGIYRNASSLFRAKRASCFFKSIFCNNCKNFSTTDSIASMCSVPLSVDKYNIEKSIKIYPNPIDNAFSIEGIEGVIEISIYNTFGQLVFKDTQLKKVVNVNLTKGIYFINIKPIESNKTFTTKLIKL